VTPTTHDVTVWPFVVVVVMVVTALLACTGWPETVPFTLADEAGAAFEPATDPPQADNTAARPTDMNARIIGASAPGRVDEVLRAEDPWRCPTASMSPGKIF
jgi:hypothetical protein